MAQQSLTGTFGAVRLVEEQLGAHDRLQLVCCVCLQNHRRVAIVLRRGLHRDCILVGVRVVERGRWLGCLVRQLVLLGIELLIGTMVLELLLGGPFLASLGDRF